MFQVTGKKTEKCGLFVSASHPFMAATPDGFIDNESVLEVKCPYSIRKECINCENVPWLEEDEEKKLHLKETHSYFYQVNA